jgi:hypothetical protein
MHGFVIVQILRRASSPPGCTCTCPPLLGRFFRKASKEGHAPRFIGVQYPDNRQNRLELLATVSKQGIPPLTSFLRHPLGVARVKEYC